MIILGQIVLITIIYVFIRVKTLSNTNYVASRYIKREKGSLPFDVRRAKTSLLKVARLDFFRAIPPKFEY